MSYPKLNKQDYEQYLKNREINTDLLEACKSAESCIQEALGDISDHFTIKHLKLCLNTIIDAINKAERG